MRIENKLFVGAWPTRVGEVTVHKPQSTNKRCNKIAYRSSLRVFRNNRSEEKSNKGSKATARATVPLGKLFFRERPDERAGWETPSARKTLLREESEENTVPVRRKSFVRAQEKFLSWWGKIVVWDGIGAGRY
ncbi:hypothetical protein CEXT_771811 [Caerostris extrusa]|uniref:Uncharacterized protein n=1 Tax=Caerostris extrusa TaxID=172846 RepID=A0AAV4URD5_CAEEX|nr:hypothetical protein CEXT_771811 [Caerostris extrusa]